MAALEESDIQQLVLSGHGRFEFGYVILYQVLDGKLAKSWLRGQLPKVSFGGPQQPEQSQQPVLQGKQQAQRQELKSESECPTRVNVAFTHAGFEKLGLPAETLRGFSNEFAEGPLVKRRLRFMGDEGSSDPEEWAWGASCQDPVHILLLLYAKDWATLEALYDQVGGAPRKKGVGEIQKLSAHLNENRAGHFGFRDGIVQPVIEGRDRAGHPQNTVAPGEFLLGYRNGRGLYPASPAVPDELDPHKILAERGSDGGGRDFGRNGSYLVYRQLRQNVEQFWDFIGKAVQAAGGDDAMESAKIRLAAKMVGRWPSGAPLVRAPDRDDEELLEEQDEYFGYHADDKEGHRCPLGSHIRRSNPRDSLEPDPEASLRVSNLHRIIRRGRPYEIPDPFQKVDETVGRKKKGGQGKRSKRGTVQSVEQEEEKGLHFICLNADIATQFEFIQHDWINNPKFDGVLYADTDPIAGVQHLRHPERTNIFTIQKDPIREKVKGLQRFVDVRGGAYFFLPGRRALEYLVTY